MATAKILIHYPTSDDATLELRGTHPLSWNEGLKGERVSNELWEFEVTLDGELEFKPVFGESWSQGRNYRVLGPGRFEIWPFFGSRGSRVDLHRDWFQYKGESVAVEIYLPPSYFENTLKRYPVLYAQDGQNLFSSATQPTDWPWHLEVAADRLILEGFTEEFLVVALERRTGQGHVDYTPYADPKLGGGGANEYATFLLEKVKPAIDRRLRTMPERETTGVIGSSLAALFAFYAGRTFPTVFSKVAALSTSFQWAGVRMIRDVKRSTSHYPIRLYLDADASGEEWEAYQLMQEMVRELILDGLQLGRDLYAHVDLGQRQSEKGWADRVHYPLLFLFPWQDLRARTG